MSKIAIFASGEGSNADEIIRFFKSQNLGIEVELIACNKEKAGVYKVANRNQIPVFYANNKLFSTGVAIVEELEKKKIDWIVLAGFLRKIPKAILTAYPNRIINLHPSLLPKYGGKGMYGKFVHEAVIANQEKESGISIHLVNEEFDKGKLLAQFSCSVNAEETVESLSKKIQKLEHIYFPQVISEYIRSNSKNEN